MAWGGGWGGGGGAMFGGRGAQSGLPFGGIPSELADEAEKLLASEPEHEPSASRVPPTTRAPRSANASRLPRDAAGVPATGRLRFAPGHRHQPVAPGRAPAHRVRHQPRHDRRDHRSTTVVIVCAVARTSSSPSSRAFGQRVQATVTGTLAVARDARPAHPGLHPLPATQPGLLHRREGRRLDESHDERHREPPTTDPGRHQLLRAAGTHDDRDHGHPLQPQRRRSPRGRCSSSCRCWSSSPIWFHRASETGLPAQPRPHRQRARRTCRSRSTASASSPRTIASGAISAITATWSGPTATPTSTPDASTRSTVPPPS